MTESSMPDEEADSSVEPDDIIGSEDQGAAGFAVQIDLEDINNLVEANDDKFLIARKIISAERDYTIEQLQNKEPTAWNNVAKRFLKIAVCKYQDIVHFYLPGVDKQDAISAVADILRDLHRDVAKYQSIPEFEAAIRKALVRDIKSLYRKFLTQKRGSGEVLLTSELQGLEVTDEVESGSNDPEDEIAPSSREGKLHRAMFDWDSHLGVDPDVNRADERRIRQESLELLSDFEKQILHLRVVEELKHRDIAERTGKNVKQIGVELARAEKKLRKLVAAKTLSEKKHLL